MYGQGMRLRGGIANDDGGGSSSRSRKTRFGIAGRIPHRNDIGLSSDKGVEDVACDTSFLQLKKKKRKKKELQGE